ncbi:MAG: GNAT family protein [Nocardiopsaceae bacterium]|nr:GNAT family protein [Nocardiopsaceae bacterium]
MVTCRLNDTDELRPLEPWHAEDLSACVEAARDALKPWPFVASRVRDVESARRLLRGFTDRRARDTGHYYGVWSSGRLVGAAMFRTFDTRNQTCEVGVWLIPTSQGRGLATRALHRLTDWAIRERGMQRVQLQTSPHNFAGRDLARRLGMTHEGTLRSAVTVNETRHDSEIWAVLASEWPGQEEGQAGAARRRPTDHSC